MIRAGATYRLAEAIQQCMAAANAITSNAQEFYLLNEDINTCNMPAGCYMDTHGPNVGKIGFNRDMTESCPDRVDPAVPDQLLLRGIPICSR